MMKEAKDLLKEVGKIVDIPKDLHPDSNPEHAAMLGQLGGVIRVYAQNGAIWDLVLADGSKKQTHQQDLAIVVCNMILKANEKTKKLPKVEPKVTEELAEAEAEIAEDFEAVEAEIVEVDTPEEFLDATMDPDFTGEEETEE